MNYEMMNDEDKEGQQIFPFSFQPFNLVLGSFFRVNVLNGYIPHFRFFFIPLSLSLSLLVRPTFVILIFLLRSSRAASVAVVPLSCSERGVLRITKF